MKASDPSRAERKVQRSSSCGESMKDNLEMLIGAELPCMSLHTSHPVVIPVYKYNINIIYVCICISLPWITHYIPSHLPNDLLTDFNV